MITVVEQGSRLKITDEEKNEVVIHRSTWDPIEHTESFHRPIDEAIAGIETTLLFPEAGVCVESAKKDQWQSFVSDPGPLFLEEDTHVVQVESNVASYVKFTGAATIRRDGGGHVELSFPSPTPVTIGFKSRVRKPTTVVTVPQTLEGVTTAITALTSAIETIGPERSYSTIRRHPPLITIGDHVDIPASVQQSIPESGIEIHLPRELDQLFIAAPLAYYLQATLRLVAHRAPRLVNNSGNTIYEFEDAPEFQHDASGFLKHVFYLDCLVRNVGQWGTTLAELSILDDTCLDPVDAFAASPSERLEQYVAVPREHTESKFPPWHLAMYVEPTYAHVPVIPHILDRLGAIYAPGSKPLSTQEILNRSLEDAYSSAKTRSAATAPAIQLVLPELNSERVHGWIADGVPIDVFKVPPNAFENRFDYLQTSTEPLRFTVILNDDDMHNERDAVSRIYTDRAEDLSIELHIQSDLTTKALADTFEEHNDFIHYIGHCDVNGLKCTNGYLPIRKIKESNAKTFFLNACNSYQEGIELVKKGSIAGGVTLNSVLDEQATKIGTTFARLLVYGFSIEQALKIARRQTITNKQYLVVGDGTYTLAQGDDVYPSTVRIKNCSDNKFIITYETNSVDAIGQYFSAYRSNSGENHLIGNQVTFELSREGLIEEIKQIHLPIFYNNELYWSTDLLQVI